jgi:hypothetical protein
MTNEPVMRLREFFHRLRSRFRAKQLDTELDAGRPSQARRQRFRKRKPMPILFFRVCIST